MKICKNEPLIFFKSSNNTKTLEQTLRDKSVADKSFEIEDIFVKNIANDKELAQTLIRDYIGCGSSAIAFETENGEVLKLTEGNHYPFGRPRENFDVPIYREGKINKIHYYFEEKLLQHGLSDGFVEIMRDMIREKGYKPYDLEENAIHQIGISSKGTLHLIDPECAQFKTIFHALWKKSKTALSSKLSFSHFSKALHKLQYK